DALGKRKEGATIPAIVSGLPSDAYGRGAVAPILPNQPTLFFVAGIQNICHGVAELVIDAPRGEQTSGASRWSSSAPDLAIDDFVGTVMALAPSDPRSAPARAILASHFAAAIAEPKTTRSEALRSTFVAACMAPSAISIG